MVQKLFNLILGFIILTLPFSATHAQNIFVGLPDDVIQSSGLDPQEVIKFKRISTNLLSNYIRSSSFVDGDGKFDKTKFNTIFQEVFISDADVYNYILEEPRQMTLSEFSAFVMKYVKQGIEIEPNEAEITRMKRNASGDVEIEVQFRLDVYGIVKDKNQLQKLVKGRNTYLKGVIIAEKGNEENAKFLRIEGVTEKVKQPGRFGIFSTTLSYGSGKVSTTSAESAFFSKVKPDFKFIGISAQYNRTTGIKNLMLWTGVQFSKYQINTSFNSENYTGSLGRDDNQEFVSYQYFNGTSFQSGTTPGLIIVDKIDRANETFDDLPMIELLAGIKYKINVGTNDRIMLGLAVCPRYGFTSSNGRRLVDFTGFSLPSDVKGFPSLDELKQNGISSEYAVTKNVEIEDVTLSSHTGLTSVCNITYQKHLSFKWGLEAGVGYRRDLTNILSSRNISEASLVRDSSILEDYFFAQRAGGVSVQIGLFYKVGNYF